MMAGYQRVYGLKCLGPHRRLADEIFKGAFGACQACQGQGVVDSEVTGGWDRCLACDGNGSVATLPAEEIERRRAIVLEAFPNAAAPAGPLVLTDPPGNGRFIAVRESLRRGPSQQEAGPISLPAASAARPSAGDLVMPVIFTLLLAPFCLFAALACYRQGRPLAGTTLLSASAFSALCGLIVAAPMAFGRRWLWAPAGLALTLLALLFGGAVHAARAGLSLVRRFPAIAASSARRGRGRDDKPNRGQLRVVLQAKSARMTLSPSLASAASDEKWSPSLQMPSGPNRVELGRRDQCD
jgi:hypothetical protein